MKKKNNNNNNNSGVQIVVLDNDYISEWKNLIDVINCHLISSVSLKRQNDRCNTSSYMVQTVPYNWRFRRITIVFCGEIIYRRTTEIPLTTISKHRDNPGVTEHQWQCCVGEYSTVRWTLDVRTDVHLSVHPLVFDLARLLIHSRQKPAGQSVYRSVGASVGRSRGHRVRGYFNPGNEARGVRTPWLMNCCHGSWLANDWHRESGHLSKQMAWIRALLM